MRKQNRTPQGTLCPASRCSQGRSRPRWAPGPAPCCPATDQSPLPVSLFHGVPQGRSFTSFLVVSWPSVLFITFPLVGHFHCVLSGCYSTSIYKGWCGTGRCQVVYLGSVLPQAPCGSLPWQQLERPASFLPLFLITRQLFPSGWRETWWLLCGSGLRVLPSPSLRWLPRPHPRTH